MFYLLVYVCLSTGLLWLIVGLLWLIIGLFMFISDRTMVKLQGNKSGHVTIEIPWEIRILAR